MNTEKKDEHIMNELFDDFTENGNNNGKNKLEKKQIKKGVIILLFIGVIFIYFGILLTKSEETGMKVENTVFIEPNNATNINNNIKKVEKPLIYSNFFHDVSWGTDISISNFNNYWGEENLIIQSDKSIKVLYPKGSYKPSVNPRGGAGFIYDIGETNNVLALSYDIEFANNFDFIRGGKLPGLCGGDCPRGGVDSNNGFSVRFSWKKDGFLDTYSVFPGSSKFGDYSGIKMFQFSAGNKYNIKQKIKLNTPGTNDGILQVFVNGQSVYLNNKMIYRNNPEVQISSLFFNTFFGGSDDSWATPNDTHILFNNLRIEQ